MAVPGTADNRPCEWLVDDRPAACPYLDARTAHMPMRLPSRPLAREEFGRRLKMGDRRQGVLLYRPTCPSCRSCQAIRVPVASFRHSRTQRRVARRGDSMFRTTISIPTVTREKVELYNRHKIERGLLIGPELLDAFGYEQFLVESCVETIEIDYHDRDRLVGVAIADRADDAVSAVYCYFDPDYEKCSPGTYSILKMITLCREWSLAHLYLGLYVAGCASMEYKARYVPHERLINGRWRRFTDPPG